MALLSTMRSVMQMRPIELDPVTRRLARVACVADLRAIAKRRLPSGVFDYIDGAAEDERALANNVAAFGRYTFRPRVLRDVGEVDTTSTVLGKPVSMPLIMAPTGFTRIAHPQGELAVARAAARAGVPYTLSTMGTRSLEEVAAAAGDGRRFFQVYVWRDRGVQREMIARAKDAGFEALMPTVDTAVLGRRERDVRRGFSLPPKLGLGTLIDGILHPAWTLAFVRSEPIRFANVAGSGHIGDGETAVSLSKYIGEQFDPTLSWKDLEWFREQWDGPIVVKGIQSVEDAEIAADVGVEAIALSNHGGRQLDDAPTPIDLVAPVADAVGGRTEIYCDGGIRRGSDIVKALALGADACMIGRAYLFGLAAAGERGVDFVLNDLREGIARTLALLGASNIAALNRDYVA